MQNRSRTAVLNDLKNPLVSIRITSYNYGRYLRECIDSVINQTYPNIEICFSDNSSTDDSWEIALEYQRRFPDIMNVANNRRNFGQPANNSNCIFFSRGKYIVQMCADDAMGSEFTEKCVNVLEKNPECGYAMVNRSIMDENSTLTEEPPFYNKSCIVNGAEQAAVYMMAAVNPSISQIMYVRSKASVQGGSVSEGLAGKWYGSRILDFKLCCNYPMAYIKDPLLLHRIHGENDSLKAADNLIEVIGPFLLHYQFVDIARSYNLAKVAQRLPIATEKVSQLAVRYCARFLISGNENIAERYFHLAAALSLKIKSNETFIMISRYWTSGESEKQAILDDLNKEINLVTREISYDPPGGSIEINVINRLEIV